MPQGDGGSSKAGTSLVDIGFVDSLEVRDHALQCLFYLDHAGMEGIHGG